MATASPAVRNEELNFRNTAFAIHHLIDDCPPFTVIRELVKNAVENSSTVSPVGRIEWFIEEVNGVKKLGLYNEGPGMSDSELSTLMDLASTAKSLGIDQNYGQGGKISSLKVSPHGVIYRSCKAGRVSQIILCAENRAGLDFPHYVKRRQQVIDDRHTWQSVIDVTNRYKRTLGRTTDIDWTEVVLLGMNADQNTVAELVPSMKSHNWLMRLINLRFFRFPPNVVIARANVNASNGNQFPRNATGLEDLTSRWSEHQEEVEAEHQKYGKLAIRYYRLKGNYLEDNAGNTRSKTMEAYGVGTRGDHLCLVWRDECYDMQTGWSKISGPFGVTFGSANIAIQILLPDNAPVKNNTYRDGIIDRFGDHQPVRVQEFAELVRQHRPEWLVRYVEEQGRKNSDDSGVMERLKEFLNQINATADSRPKVDGTGDEQGEADNHDKTGRGEKGDGDSDRKRGEKSATGERTASQRLGIPRVIFTTDPGKLEEMKGRAAIYVRDDAGSIVMLNPHHWRYLDDLQRICDEVGPDAENQAVARNLFDEEYKFSAGKFVLLAWIFRGKPEWTDKDWADALDMQSFTVYLADPGSLASAQHKLRQRLNTRKMKEQHGS